MSAALLAAGLLLVLMMAGAWLVQRRTGNSGWIDTIWSLSTGAAALTALMIMPGDEGRRWLLAGLVGLWSGRLGLHILKRTGKSLDDPRYAALMTQWGSAAPLRLFLFLQIQAAAGVVLVTAIILAAASSTPLLSFGTLAFTILACVALIGEGLADMQLAACKRIRPADGICDSGLWAVSRHPNYLFEWLFWVAIAGLAVAPATNIVALLALAAPLMMYGLLRYGSGVPHVEAHLQRTRPEAFAAYAVRVPIFFPRLRLHRKA